MATDQEIVEVLATKAMGGEIVPYDQWIRRRKRFAGVYVLHEDGRLSGPTDERGNSPHYFNPLESWVDAGMVAEAIATRGIAIEMGNYDHNSWLVLVDPKPGEGGSFPQGLTLPRAISLAAYEWAISEAAGQ